MLRFGRNTARHFHASDVDADDAVQIVALRLFRLQQANPAMIWGRQYIYTAVHNALVEIWRREKRQAAMLAREEPLAVPSVEDLVDMRQRLAAVGPALLPSQRQRFLRVFFHRGTRSNGDKQALWRMRQRLIK